MIRNLIEEGMTEEDIAAAVGQKNQWEQTKENMQEKTCVRTTSLQKRNSEAAAALSYEINLERQSFFLFYSEDYCLFTIRQYNSRVPAQCFSAAGMGARITFSTADIRPAFCPAEN